MKTSKIAAFLGIVLVGYASSLYAEAVLTMEPRLQYTAENHGYSLTDIKLEGTLPQDLKVRWVARQYPARNYHNEPATPGMDFTPVEGFVVFKAGESGRKTFKYTIVNDKESETYEFFALDIDTPTVAGLRMGQYISIYGYITDDDNYCLLRDKVASPDVNNDKAVNIVDINAVRNTYGKTGEFHIGDADCNGIVDTKDLNLVRNNMGLKL
jgi:hypothetical protein